MIRTLRFFCVAPPIPRLMISTFLVVTVISTGVVAIAPHRSTGVLTAVCLLQLFSASAGFAAPARRGYYDLLLTRGDRRIAIGLAHWAMSVVPGVASWVVIAGLEAAVTGAAETSLAPGTVSAIVLASTVPWATAVALPRFAGAVGWLLVMVLTSTLVPPLAGQAPSPWPAQAAAVLLLPGTFIGRPFPTGSLVAAPALAFGVMTMAVALRWIDTSDVPLETAQ